jgi:phospholipase/carboxylesterase
MERRPEAIVDGPALDALGLVHRVLRPEAGTAGPHPTAVMIHGMGGDERVMWPFSSSLPAGWLQLTVRGILPAEHHAYTWVHRGPDEWPDLAAFGPAAARLGRFVAGLPAAYGADPDRVVLIGFSQGAALAFAAAMTWGARGDQPRRPAGVASLVGFVPEGGDVSARPLEGLPVFMAVGARDALVPIQRARASVALAEGLGATVTSREYEAGHKVPVIGLRDLAAWCGGLGLGPPLR